MEQYAPESLSPSILPEAQGALEVGQKRQAIELELGKVKAAKDAEKAKTKAAAKKEMPALESVYFMQHQNGKKLYNNYLEGLTALERQAAENPDNPDYDPYEPGSRANLQLDALTYQMTSAAKRSQELGKVYETALTTYAGRTDIDPRFFQDLKEWVASPEALEGTVARPDPYTYADKTKVRAGMESVAAETDAWATPTGDGYVQEGSDEARTSAGLWSKAQSFADDEYWRGVYEIEYSQLSPARKAEIDMLAKDNKVHHVAALIYDQNKDLLAVKETRKLSADPNFGAGGIKRMEKAAEWFVEQMGNIQNGNFDAFNYTKLTDADKNAVTSLPTGSYDVLSTSPSFKNVIGKIRSQTKLPASVSDMALFNAWDAAGRPTEFGAYVDQNQLNTGSQTVKIGDKTVPVNTRQAAVFTYKDQQGKDMIVTLDEYDIENAVTETGENTDEITAALGTKALSGEAKVFTAEEYPNYAYGTMVQSGLNKELDPSAVNSYSERRGGTVKGPGWKPITPQKGGTTVTYPTGSNPFDQPKQQTTKF